MEMCILNCGLENKREDILLANNNNELLVDFINLYKKTLKHNDVEIFEQIDNILITSDGYYIATDANNLTIE